MPWFITAPMFVLWIPLGFRATCYYYRKAYYRAFFWDPPACLASAQEKEPRKAENYRGERAVFVINNVHRYFLYASLVVVAFLWYDTVLTFFPEGSFAIRVGSLIWLVNVVLISAYTFSCHSLAAPGRGEQGLLQLRARRQRPPQALQRGEPFEPQASAVGVVQPLLVADHRHLHEAFAGGDNPRPDDYRVGGGVAERRTQRAPRALRDARARRPDHRRRRRGLEGRGRRRGARPLGRHRHQEPARQGPHRNGRGRHRGRRWERRPRRLLAPALHRHHEERQVPQQLADGRDLHQGGPRQGLRARAVGRALQQDAARQDLPAPLRRTYVQAFVSRRRQDGSGADPDHAGEGPRHRRRGLHGDDHHQALQEGRAGRRAPWPTRGRTASSSTSRPRPSSWRPAAGDASSR